MQSNAFSMFQSNFFINFQDNIFSLKKPYQVQNRKKSANQYEIIRL